MRKSATTVTFKGTMDQEHKLNTVMAKYRNVPGALMPVLQEAQGIYGYLPIEVQRLVADGMGVSLAEVYGIVTFYSQFSLNPKGDVSIAVCLGTACYVKGAGPIIEHIESKIKVKAGQTSSDGKFSLEATRCVGACGLAPVVVINDDVYGRLTRPEEIDPILAKYTKN